MFLSLIQRFESYVHVGRGDAQYRSLKLAGNLRKAAHTAAPGSAGFQPASTEQQFRQMPPGWRRSQAEAASLSEGYWGDPVHRQGDAWRLPYTTFARYFGIVGLVVAVEICYRILLRKTLAGKNQCGKSLTSSSPPI